MATAPRLIAGQRAPFAQEDGAGALLHPAALSAVAGSASRLLALAGACPGANVGVLSRAMEELERLAAGAAATATGRAELSTSTAADMDIDAGGGSSQLGSGTKRKRDAPGAFQVTASAKRRILAWRVPRWQRRYRSSVAKAMATAWRARTRRARPTRRRTGTGGWKSVEQQLARATLCDGLHRWSPGGGGGGGPTY
jgi:hypothetical protein